jgi:hypothetical protein
MEISIHMDVSAFFILGRMNVAIAASYSGVSGFKYQQPGDTIS